MNYRDYYKILGVPRDADAEQIKKAYRKLARKVHPDVNKSSDAETRFKEASEAYEVLRDPKKRQRYDTLGADWKSGQEFRPPPGWENVRFDFGGGGPGRVNFEDLGFDVGGGESGGFSDFFEVLFGGAGARAAGGQRRRSGARMRQPPPSRGEDHEAALTITLDEAYHGVSKAVTLEAPEMTDDGTVRSRRRSYDVRIPAGTMDGSRIRLPGQGGRGGTGAPAGDLYLRIHVAPHSVFRLNGADIEVELLLTPWEAALGAVIALPTLDGTASLRVPPGTQSGQRIRLRGKGMKRRGGEEGRGDLFAVVRLVVPRDVTGRERELFEELARTSGFNPRQT